MSGEVLLPGSQAADFCVFTWQTHGRKGEVVLWGLFIKALILFMRVPPS